MSEIKLYLNFFKGIYINKIKNNLCVRGLKCRRCSEPLKEMRERAFKVLRSRT